LGVVGGSGTGKSVLMRSIIGLQRPDAGEIIVFGEPVLGRDEGALQGIRKRWGILFQGAALFSTLTVAENVQVPLREFYPRLGEKLMDEIASYKIVMVGLSADAGPKYPAELSGGMKKRAGIARALALDPELLFLDEPTAGLDPIGAAAFDQLIRELSSRLGLTVFLITHDLDTLYSICDRVAVIADRKVIAVGTIPELLALDHEWIQEYFRGPRGRAAEEANEANEAEEAEEAELAARAQTGDSES
jgi:phospholipid/cholesterol/gamma-HCH transport system ATP-binding protein